SDWNITDWFCLKVLAKMLEYTSDPTELAMKISAWRTSKHLWQRRAACVAFVNHAKFGDEKIAGLPDMIMTSCEALVLDPERFAQTGVGWVLRELSLFDQARVTDFAERHIKDLSREAIKSLAEKMPDGDKRRLLEVHKT
ncbi:DNA alkylation repair protein, partial [Myxococcota bacterium]|nr:DNA alkylation repair protein [Myxococcota bacterium]